MKKLKFLLLALAATLSLGAWADVKDGIYYLKSVTTGKYVSRGSDWNTRAIVDDWGVAVQVETAEGKTTCKFVDSNLNLFATDDGYVFTDNASTNIQWILIEETSGFSFKNVNKDTFINLVEANGFTNLHQDASNYELFTFEPASEHPSKMAALYATTKASAFTAAGVDASKLSTDYAAKKITVSDPVSSVAEQYQGWATIKTQTLSGLKTGLYKVTVNAFHRITGNDATYTAYQGGYASPVVYLFANNMKYQIHSVMDEPATTPWVSGNDYQKDGNYYPNGMTGSAAAFNAGKYLNEAWVYVTDGKLTFGLQNDSKVTNGNWTCYQNFTVTYYTDEVSDEDAEAILASVPTAKMAPSVLAALTTAKENFEAKKTIANYNALTTAIASANVSVAIYAKLKDAIDLANELCNENATGANDFNNAKSEAQGKYEKTDEDINVDATVATLKTAIKTYLSNNETNIVVNGTFESDTKGWTSTTGAQNSGLANNKQGDFIGNFWENWNGSPKTGKMYQTNASALPAGQYALKIAAFGDQNPANEKSKLFVYVNDNKQRVVSDNPTYYYVPFTLIETAAIGTIEYGLIAEEDIDSKWIGIDNVSICFLGGMDDFYATEDDYNALKSALNAVSNKMFGFEKDEYAPYNNVEVAKAIAHANTINPTVKNIAADVRAATNTIKNAVWVANETEVNAVYDGSFAKATNNGAPAGWTMSNNTLGGDYHSRAFVNDDRLTEFNDTKSGLFLRFDGTNSNRGSQYFYGQTEGYTMPLKAETVYYVSVDAKNWGDKIEKPLRLNITGPSGFTTEYQDLNLISDADKNNDEPQHFLIVFTTTTAGNYQISFQCPGADTNAHNALISNVELKKAESFDATMTKIGDAAYSSMYLDYPVEIPEGVEAYYVTVDGRTAMMNEIEDVIPANCGVILKAAEDVDKITFTQTSTAATTDVSDNVLIGFVVDTEVEEGKAHYAFGYKGDKVAFYIPESAESDTDPTSKFTAKAHKAYIELESAPNSKLDITWGGEATGINTIDNGQLTIDNSKAYNLNGMRVSSNYKGIVLKGGKKFLQK